MHCLIEEITEKTAVLPENLQQEVLLNETALLSEQALARDWNRPEEDEAYAGFQI